MTDKLVTALGVMFVVLLSILAFSATLYLVVAFWRMILNP